MFTESRFYLFLMLICAQKLAKPRLKAILPTNMKSPITDGNKNLKYSRIAVIIMGDLKVIFKASSGTFNHRLEDRGGLNLTNR